MKILILANNDVGLYQFRRELIQELMKESEMIILVNEVITSSSDGIRAIIASRNSRSSALELPSACPESIEMLTSAALALIAAKVRQQTTPRNPIRSLSTYFLIDVFFVINRVLRFFLGDLRRAFAELFRKINFQCLSEGHRFGQLILLAAVIKLFG